jgi:hypothetical protein
LDSLRAHDPDHPELLSLLAGVFLRLDRCERYDEMAEGEVHGCCGSAGVRRDRSQIGVRDITRDNIRGAALRLLQEWEQESAAQSDTEAEVSDDEQQPLLLSFYDVIGARLHEMHDQPIYRYMREERRTVSDVVKGLARPDVQIPARNRAVLRLLFEGPHTIEGWS